MPEVVLNMLKTYYLSVGDQLKVGNFLMLCSIDANVFIIVYNAVNPLNNADHFNLHTGDENYMDSY